MTDPKVITNTELIVAQSLSANYNSDAILIEQMDTCSFQLDFTYGGGDDSAGDIKIQISNNGGTWVDMEDKTIAFTNASTTNIIGLDMRGFSMSSTVCCAAYARLKIKHDSGTGGTVGCIFHGEQRAV